jgi:transcriptional regulator with XRE-family HTH domain
MVKRSRASLAKRLRVIRAEKQLTLREAAELVGIRSATLFDIEHGNVKPHDVTLAKIAKGYGVPAEDLIEEPVQEPELAAGKVEAPQDTGQNWPRVVPEAPGIAEFLRQVGIVAPLLGEVEHMVMEREDFEALRAAVHEYPADESAALFSELNREYNRVWDAWTAMDPERTSPSTLEWTRNLLIESRKRWTVLLYERQAPVVRQDERREPDAPDLPDTTNLPLDEAFELARSQVAILA